jgi:hypothetical protein
MPNLKQNPDGSMGIQGTQLDDGGFVNASFNYDSSCDGQSFFVADRPYVVKNIVVVPFVAGTDTGTVSLTIKKAADGSAMDSTATSLHTSTINAKGTIATLQRATLATSSATLSLARGNRLGVDVTGTMTSAKGLITVLLAPK